jgi:hypothetical protein
MVIAAMRRGSWALLCSVVLKHILATQVVSLVAHLAVFGAANYQPEEISAAGCLAVAVVSQFASLVLFGTSIVLSVVILRASQAMQTEHEVRRVLHWGIMLVYLAAAADVVVTYSVVPGASLASQTCVAGSFAAFFASLVAPTLLASLVISGLLFATCVSESLRRRAIGALRTPQRTSAASAHRASVRSLFITPSSSRVAPAAGGGGADSSASPASASSGGSSALPLSVDHEPGASGAVGATGCQLEPREQITHKAALELSSLPAFPHIVPPPTTTTEGGSLLTLNVVHESGAAGGGRIPASHTADDRLSAVSSGEGPTAASGTATATGTGTGTSSFLSSAQWTPPPPPAAGGTSSSSGAQPTLALPPGVGRVGATTAATTTLVLDESPRPLPLQPQQVSPSSPSSSSSPPHAHAHADEHAPAPTHAHAHVVRVADASPLPPALPAVPTRPSLVAAASDGSDMQPTLPGLAATTPLARVAESAPRASAAAAPPSGLGALVPSALRTFSRATTQPVVAAPAATPSASTSASARTPSAPLSGMARGQAPPRGPRKLPITTPPGRAAFPATSSLSPAPRWQQPHQAGGRRMSGSASGAHEVGGSSSVTHTSNTRDHAAGDDGAGAAGQVPLPARPHEQDDEDAGDGEEAAGPGCTWLCSWDDDDDEGAQPQPQRRRRRARRRAQGAPPPACDDSWCPEFCRMPSEALCPYPRLVLVLAASIVHHLASIVYVRRYFLQEGTTEYGWAYPDKDTRVRFLDRVTALLLAYPVYFTFLTVIILFTWRPIRWLPTHLANYLRHWLCHGPRPPPRPWERRERPAAMPLASGNARRAVAPQVHVPVRPAVVAESA